MAKNMFSQKLNKAILEKNSRLCVGLDPRLELLPKTILNAAIKKHGQTNQAAADAITTFNKQVLDTVVDLACCVKPQIAFYEQFGAEGIQSFWDTVKYAKSLDLVVIADIKRGDIGSTAQGYAHAYLGGNKLFNKKVESDIDSITINPFLGEDTLEPFVSVAKQEQKGLFVLVKTSNPGSKDLQDLKIDNQSISMRVAQMINHQAESLPLDEYGYHSLGAVIGATYPKSAQQFRKVLPQSIFLVPGIGAQGGDPSLLKHFFNKDKLGAIVNSSRGITFTFKPNEKNYLTDIRKSALETRDLINHNL
ncbi:MAG: orotidine-5'-phosphate decarboxylase [Candidatus Pacebacteria bacterium]|nr:orotidine-5'-phosphate decarboxylase [Candidatus Paceibacterota bacterium]